MDGSKNTPSTDTRSYMRDGRAPIPHSEITSRLMSANKANNTGPELTLRKALWHAGLKGYRLHWRKVPGKPDIAFPGKKIAVFVHGCFWHRCPNCASNFPKTNTDFWQRKFESNVKRDKANEEHLHAEGWSVITIWECEIKKNIKNIVNNIKNHTLNL